MDYVGLNYFSKDGGPVLATPNGGWYIHDSGLKGKTPFSWNLLVWENIIMILLKFTVWEAPAKDLQRFLHFQTASTVALPIGKYSTP